VTSDIRAVLKRERLWAVATGDCRDVLPGVPSICVDAVVTDPPAGIAFMGSGRWDNFGDRQNARKHFIHFIHDTMAEAYRVMKPGAYAVVWSHPKTSHWTAMGIEDVGFEITDKLTHIFGTGWNKNKHSLKSGSEIWILCRKPLNGTIAENVEKWGTGILNIETCRVPRGSKASWPPNVLLSHLEGCDESACVEGCVVRTLDEQSGQSKSRIGKPRSSKKSGDGYGMTHTGAEYSDEGGASRFFPTFWYKGRASAKERHSGCEGLLWLKDSTRESAWRPVGLEEWQEAPEKLQGKGNIHNTVKPMSLLQWLCRLVTPPGGVVLDLFAGSGGTGVAAIKEGLRPILVEQLSDYALICNARLGQKESPEQLSPSGL
jgi:site-specific DNA-methyltransferase (adenine-specific)